MARQGYYGMISYIDDKVGEIIEVMDKTGLSESTVVVFTSDHGEMMGERGMWFKQHFFEWASRVPFIIAWPGRFKPARVDGNISLIDLMPTLLDIAAGGEFAGYAAPCDGVSLVPVLNGDTSSMADLAISEFAADGSTGPSRMVKKRNWKLMWLEGQDTLLYDVESDPDETRNLAGQPEAAGIQKELEGILFDGWDPDALYKEIRASQERRLAIHRITGGEPGYVNMVRLDDEQRYIRNAGAADTKALARFPYVEPAQADKTP